MTIIVWDGKTLAADRQLTNANLKARHARKIWRFGDVMMGGAGAMDHISAMRDWVMGGCKPEAFPKPTTTESYCSVFWVINRNGTTVYFEDNPHPIEVMDKQFAEGSGRDFAYGALAMGADAYRAAEIACEHDYKCGGGIDILTFED